MKDASFRAVLPRAVQLTPLAQALLGMRAGDEPPRRHPVSSPGAARVHRAAHRRDQGPRRRGRRARTALRSLVYIGLAGPGVDERAFNELRQIRADHGSVSLEQFKADAARAVLRAAARPRRGARRDPEDAPPMPRARSCSPGSGRWRPPLASRRRTRRAPGAGREAVRGCAGSGAAALRAAGAPAPPSAAAPNRPPRSGRGQGAERRRPGADGTCPGHRGPQCAGSSSFKFSLFALAPEGRAARARARPRALHRAALRRQGRRRHDRRREDLGRRHRARPRRRARPSGRLPAAPISAGTISPASATASSTADQRTRRRCASMPVLADALRSMSARAAAPAAQPGTDPRDARTRAAIAAGGVLRHRVPPPPAAGGQAYALPRAISERGVLRYGFHGLSYEYIASVLPHHDARAPRRVARPVVAHLGNGASMCAIDAGRSVASTMGFTAADGLPMGTRCGNLDPGSCST